MTASRPSQNISKVPDQTIQAKSSPNISENIYQKEGPPKFTQPTTLTCTHIFIYIYSHIFIFLHLYTCLHIYIPTASYLRLYYVSIYTYFDFCMNFSISPLGAYNQNFGNLISKRTHRLHLGRANIRYPALLVENICSNMEGRKLPEIHP